MHVSPPSTPRSHDTFAEWHPVHARFRGSSRYETQSRPSRVHRLQGRWSVHAVFAVRQWRQAWSTLRSVAFPGAAPSSASSARPGIAPAGPGTSTRNGATGAAGTIARCGASAGAGVGDAEFGGCTMSWLFWSTRIALFGTFAGSATYCMFPVDALAFIVEMEAFEAAASAAAGGLRGGGRLSGCSPRLEPGAGRRRG